ncbi:MAG TPA: hypothetical protein PKL92_07540 [Aquaticitalea sp.]|nr:hypothetical protein [Aquaticitalea sp.]HNU58966.1 hypothetical protein [Aquaticitalea sp.]
MKKNLLSAIAIFFVTFAFLFVVDDISKKEEQKTEVSVEYAGNTENQQSVIATTDLEEDAR